MRIFADGRLLYGGGGTGTGTGTSSSPDDDTAAAATAALDGHLERLFGERGADRFVPIRTAAYVSDSRAQHAIM